MAAISRLQTFLSQYPLLEAVLVHIEPVDFLNLQLAGISMPIRKKAAVEKMIKKKCQKRGGCDTTNEREALITCARIFKLNGSEAPKVSGYTSVPPPIPHPLREWDPEFEKVPEGEEYICRKHMVMDLEETEPYRKHAWKPLCSHHSSELSTDLSKRTLPSACFCHTEREKRKWSCGFCQRFTNDLLEDHYYANSKARREKIHRRRAACHGIVDPKELALYTPNEIELELDALERDWQGVRPRCSELIGLCPLDGCEKEACWEEIDGQFHVMYCMACRSFFQIADFAILGGWDDDDDEYDLVLLEMD